MFNFPESQKILKDDFKNSFLYKLNHIPDFPKELFVKGPIFEKNKYKFLTVVGSRACSAYAKDALEKIISEISHNKKIVIISGLALGIDAHAHKLALKYGLKTIAVPGSGLSEEVLYPKTNLKLAREILESGGSLISEFEDNFKATNWTFPKRNRIMTALSDAVLVVEAGEKSGTMITARLALDYNKNLGAIPNSIFSEYSKGSNKLLKQGANPVFCGNDILELLGEKVDNEKVEQLKIDFENFSEDEKIILDLLKEPKEKSELQKESGFDITKLNIVLSTLEIQNVVKEYLGKYRIK
ncbi:DNA-protecting protein DprA [Candidatus Campbellbacteria bacterium]|nr:MAG: DNA-protecting protein DprA [Candidatus Campbellbacteria bacterium]